MKTPPIHHEPEAQESVGIDELSNASSPIKEVTPCLEAPSVDIGTQLANLTDDQFDAMFDAAVEAAGRGQMEPIDTNDPEAVRRTAAEIAKSLGYNVSSAGQDAIEGLVKLFRGTGKPSGGLTLDDEGSSDADPHLQAGRDLYKRERYPSSIQTELDRMPGIAVMIANRWMLGWPKAVMALIAEGTYLELLKGQEELEREAYSEPGNSHLARHEIAEMYGLSPAPPTGI
jgi:hypothetical protein